MKNIIFFIFVLSAHVYALTDDEMRAYFVRYLIRCNKDTPVDVKEIFQLQKLIVPKDSAVMCLLACTYKKEGLMTEGGLLNLEHAHELVEMAKNGDEERATNGKKLVDICVKVNEASVSDGDKGCERAALLFKCGVENAPQLGFKLI